MIIYVGESLFYVIFLSLVFCHFYDIPKFSKNFLNNVEQIEKKRVLQLGG